MLGNKKFSSRGKLLLTSEYLVLKGALALAIPLKSGQILEVTPIKGKNEIHWESYDIDENYFSGIFNIQNLSCLKHNNKHAMEFISCNLIQAKRFNANFLNNKQSIKVTSKLSFSRNWGWGSSSSTISNIAKWAEINPFDLFFSTQNGSAYDIACSISDTPILYQLRKNEAVFDKIDINNTLKNNSLFIYTGKKVDTRNKVDIFKSYDNVTVADIERASAMAKEIAYNNNIKELMYLIKEHEKLIAGIIKSKPIQDESFRNFEGAIKSLGAWGGDFILAISEKGKSYIKNYFHEKEMSPIFEFDEIAL